MTIRLTNAISAVIYAERTMRGMSQSALATAAEMHKMSISKIERGLPFDIGVETLSRIGAAMGLKASEMLVLAERWREELSSEPGEQNIAGAELAAVICLRRMQ